jgi:squalene synthase HpnC
MTTLADIRPTKDEHGENFPVASWLVATRHRAPILAFYKFVRAADDIADHPSLSEADKFQLLDQLEAALLGRHDPEAAAGMQLHRALSERGLPPRHALDLLTAFRMDVTKRRYRDWDDLIHYCSYSAMPVGRFVLDVHGESRATWPANDALCAALQVINHLQDCRADYQNLDRVYIPLDAMQRAGASVEDLGAEKSSPALLRCIREVADRNEVLVREAEPFSAQIRDLRLALEVSIIQGVARRLTLAMQQRDPLSERVHLSKPGYASVGMVAVMRGLMRRAARAKLAAQAPQDLPQDR